MGAMGGWERYFDSDTRSTLLRAQLRIAARKQNEKYRKLGARTLVHFLNSHGKNLSKDCVPSLSKFPRVKFRLRDKNGDRITPK